MAHTSRNDGSAVTIGKFGVGWIQIRFIAAGLGNAGEQVVGNDAMGNGTKEAESPNMGAGPVGKRSSPGGLGIGLVTATHDTDKQLGIPHLAG